MNMENPGNGNETADTLEEALRHHSNSPFVDGPQMVDMANRIGVENLRGQAVWQELVDYVADAAARTGNFKGEDRKERESAVRRMVGGLSLENTEKESFLEEARAKAGALVGSSQDLSSTESFIESLV